MLSEAPLPRWFTDLLAHRRWVRRTRPFPHVYVRDVFVEEFYQRLVTEFERVRTTQPAVFTPIANGYSASGVSLTKVRNGPLEVFLSRAWHDLIERVAGVPTTGDVEGSLHRHEPGSPHGWPHHDLTPAYFPDPAPAPGKVGLPDTGIDLKTGARTAGTPARALVRAVAVLYYLANDEWKAGDGGETGLFTDLASATPAVAVPPLNNSMVLFECTPRSWHTFLGDNTAARNCVVMWLHRPKEEAVQRWGGDRIVNW